MDRIDKEITKTILKSEDKICDARQWKKNFGKIENGKFIIIGKIFGKDIGIIQTINLETLGKIKIVPINEETPNDWYRKELESEEITK